MTDTGPTGRTPEPLDLRTDRVVRRRYLIDPKRQLRTTLLVTSLVALLLVVVNLGFTLLRTSQTALLASAAPQLTPVLEHQNTMFSLAMIVISLVLVTAVAVATILRTHRTAGAVYAVKQRLDRVTAGDLQVRLKLRAHDNLQDLEAPFNEMIAALRSRALAEAESLDQLALTAGRMGSDGVELATVLHDLAGNKRQIGT